jgi:hypothetical protein
MLLSSAGVYVVRLLAPLALLALLALEETLLSDLHVVKVSR